MTYQFTEQDAELTRRIGVIDQHSDLPLGLLKQRFDGIEGSLGSEWLPKLRAGGVDTVVCAVYIDSVYLPEGALRRAVQTVDALFEEIDLCHAEIELALSAADVRRITGEGKIAILLAFEGAEPLGMDLSGLRLFHRLGLRMLSFAWMRRTAFGDGTWENDSRGGLTRLGQAAVEEMNRLGIVVDISHASDQTAWDILEASNRPVIASHSNTRALHDHPRNLTDDMIQAVAGSGGVVGAVAVAGFVAHRDASIARWVDHIDHIKGLVGIDHIAVGFDFFKSLREMGAAHDIPAWGPPGGMPPLEFSQMVDYPDIPGLTAELLRRDYTEEDIRKIYRENFLRVLEDTER